MNIGINIQRSAMFSIGQMLLFPAAFMKQRRGTLDHVTA